MVKDGRDVLTSSSFITYLSAFLGRIILGSIVHTTAALSFTSSSARIHLITRASHMSNQEQHALVQVGDSSNDDQNCNLLSDDDSLSIASFEDESSDDDDVRRQNLRPATGAKTVSAAWHRLFYASPDTSQSGASVLTPSESEVSECSVDDESASDRSWFSTPDYQSTSPSSSDDTYDRNISAEQHLDDGPYVDPHFVQLVPDELLEPIIFSSNHWRDGIDLAYCHAFAQPLWNIDADKKQLLPADTHWIDVDPNNDWHLERFLPLLSPPYSVLTMPSPSSWPWLSNLKQERTEKTFFEADLMRRKRRKQSSDEGARSSKRSSGRRRSTVWSSESNKTDRPRLRNTRSRVSTAASSDSDEIIQHPHRAGELRKDRPDLEVDGESSDGGEESISTPLTDIPESIQDERRGRYLIIGGRHSDGRARSPRWAQSKEVDDELIEEWHDSQDR